jgi:hypothetical protein
MSVIAPESTENSLNETIATYKGQTVTVQKCAKYQLTLSRQDLIDVIQVSDTFYCSFCSTLEKAIFHR